MTAAMQMLGAYAIFVLAALSILVFIVSCIMIALAGYEAIDWIRVNHRNFVNISPQAKAALR